MEQIRNISLDEILDCQDKSMQRAIQEHQKEWAFVKDCIELVINRRIIKEHIVENDEIKLEVVHTFLNDALSTLINSLKIALYGCFSDSMTLLRPTLEELTIMNYIVSKGSFDTANYELDRSFKKLEFETIVKSVKDGQTIKNLWGRISALAAHGTASRIRNNRFDINGRNLPTVGVSLDPERKERCLHEIMNVSLYMIRILTDFYGTKKEIISEDFFSKSSELEKRFKCL